MEEHPEKKAEYDASYRQRHLEELRKKDRSYYEQNKEKVLDKQTEYYHANKLAIAARDKAKRDAMTPEEKQKFLQFTAKQGKNYKNSREFNLRGK